METSSSSGASKQISTVNQARLLCANYWHDSIWRDLSEKDLKELKDLEDYVSDHRSAAVTSSLSGASTTSSTEQCCAPTHPKRCKVISEEEDKMERLEAWVSS